MIQFREFGSCLRVFVQEPRTGVMLPWGFIDNDGFHPGDFGSTLIVIKCDDLFTLARKTAEFLEHGSKIPVCEKCSGTPNFPKEVDGAYCNDDCHPIVASEIENYLELGSDDEAEGETVVESDA